MVLKGSRTNSIAHAGRLARHLLNERDNDRVEVIEVSGQATDNPEKAMLLMHGSVVLTEGKQGLYQVSINPAKGESMTPEQWQDAVAKLEKEFGFAGQPRAIFEHEKEGRVHRHVVWQRTDLETQTLITLDKDHHRLRDLAREMAREYGHSQVIEKSASHQFDQAAFRQAKRNGDRDPKDRAAFIREAWEASDNANAFREKLKASGYELAQGDRSPVVLVDAGSGELIQGSLRSHLKGPDRSGPKAAELREWAQGLSEPIAPVEVVKERIIDGQYFDRDKYNAEQQTRDEQAGIEQVRDQQQQEKFAANYQSYADEFDPIREREAAIHKRRHQKETELKAFYKRDERAAQLARLKLELANYQGLRGRITGRRAELEEEISALQKTLTNIDQRVSEQWQSFESQIAREWSQDEDRNAAPANGNEPDHETDAAFLERHAAMRAERESDRDMDRGMERE